MSEEKQYPSFLEQGKNLADFSFDLIKKALRSEALFVSPKVQEERMSVCRSCEFYDEKEIRCTQCGCWLEAKTKFSLDSCPLQKWDISREDWVNTNFDKLLEEGLDSK